jgi:hypothetical protein
MSEPEQAVFLKRIGEIVLDAALLRLLAGLDDAAVEELQTYLEGVEENDDVLAHLLETYPNFSEIITEEAAALREEGEAVLS